MHRNSFKLHKKDIQLLASDMEKSHFHALYIFCVLLLSSQAACWSNTTRIVSSFTVIATRSSNSSTNFTQLALSKLWSGIDVKTAPITKTVEPTPVPSQELIAPPNLPKLQGPYTLPRDFIWGWAASAGQIEGAVKADGRGPSIWDNVAHKVKGFIKGQETLDVTNNHYYLYKQDTQRLKALGVPYYSLTISWSRIFPLGNGTVNQAGLQHYVDEIDYLVQNDITPIVTLYHWDIPQALQNAYGGWLDRRVVEDFANYARVIFKALAPKVDIWITINEPQVICNDYASWPDEGVPDEVFPVFGYTTHQRRYLCGHHVLLGHARAVEIFREEIEPEYGKGRISFANSWDYTPPYSSELEDQVASWRALDFSAGWFGNPVYISGDYPQSMKDTLRDLLPSFTPEEKRLIFNSSDFYAWDGYTGHPVSQPEGGLETCLEDPNDESWPGCYEEVFTLPGGWMIGDKADPGVSSWLFNTPEYFREAVIWSWRHFKPREYIIPEFGFSMWEESRMHITHARYDEARVAYYDGYLHQVLNLINEDKVNLTGVIAWSMYDNLEWRQGTATRFGLQYVDFVTMKKYFKKSAFYMRDFFDHYIASD
jgi:beta-glucosidase/6-phospho-beta-glucosidase/beta-galactosidase